MIVQKRIKRWSAENSNAASISNLRIQFFPVHNNGRKNEFLKKLYLTRNWKDSNPSSWESFSLDIPYLAPDKCYIEHIQVCGEYTFWSLCVKFNFLYLAEKRF